jgi:hypothetical protein
MINKAFLCISIFIYFCGVESTTSARPYLLIAGLAGGFLCAIIACIKESIKEKNKNNKK